MTTLGLTLEQVRNMAGILAAVENAIVRDLEGDLKSAGGGYVKWAWVVASEESPLGVIRFLAGGYSSGGMLTGFSVDVNERYLPLSSAQQEAVANAMDRGVKTKLLYKSLA